MVEATTRFTERSYRFRRPYRIDRRRTFSNGTMNTSSVADIAEVLALESGSHKRVAGTIAHNCGVERLEIVLVP